MKIKNEKKEIKIKNTITIDYENKRLSVFYFLPLLLIAGLVPLIVYAKYVDLSGTTQALYWTGQQQYLDFFSYWKSRWIIVLTAIELIFYIILYKQKKLPLKDLKQYYIPLGIYAIFVIISTIFAIDTQTALWGFVDMYQGMFVLLSYVILTFLTINFVNNERDINLFVNAFLFLMIIEGIIGVGQYFGLDIFQTKLGNELILPNYIKVDDLSFSFGPKTIYGTLFNTNYVGSFSTLMLPMAVAFLLGAKTKKQRIISAIATILMIFVWVGCNSRAGYLGIALASIFSIWLFKKAMRKYWIEFVGLIMVLVVVLVGLNYFSDGAIFNRLKTFNVIEQIKYIKKINEKSTQIEDVVLGKDTFSIKTNEETLNFRVEDEKLYFLDENYKELDITINSNNITFNDPKYQAYRISIPKNYPGVSVMRSNYWNWASVNFYITDGGIKILGSGGRITEPLVAERFETLDGLENFMSGRGYIWSRSIPLLKNYLIKGSGADNYPIAFPQDDFVAKLQASMSASLVVDKPHNMYLQIGVNTGVLSLLSFLVLGGIYCYSSMRLYSKMNFDTLEKYLGASCLVSIIGYLFAGMFNDNVVSVAPLFCITLGLGISINVRLQKKKPEA